MNTNICTYCKVTGYGRNPLPKPQIRRDCDTLLSSHGHHRTAIIFHNRL